MAKIKVSPNVPDINSHDFTIYALNDLYESIYRLDKLQKRRRRASSFKFVVLSTAMYYIYTTLNSRLKEVEKGNETK